VDTIASFTGTATRPSGGEKLRSIQSLRRAGYGLRRILGLKHHQMTTPLP
jgi:hypothetical protein